MSDLEALDGTPIVDLKPVIQASGPVTREGLDAWLTAYGAAWEARDGERAAALFAEDGLRTQLQEWVGRHRDVARMSASSRAAGYL